MNRRSWWIELPASTGRSRAGTWASMNATVWASASASLICDWRTRSVSPDAPWCLVFQSSMAARISSVWWITSSGPTAISVSCPSVRIVAISMIRSRSGSSPVISMSSQTRTSLPAIGPLYNRALLARPGPDRAGVHVNEAALGVEPDAAGALRLGPAVQRLGRNAGDEEVDRIAVAVLAVARDLVALLAQAQVVVGMAKRGDDVDDVGVEARGGGEQHREQARLHRRRLVGEVIAQEVVDGLARRRRRGVD